jgi:integrase
MRGWGCSERRNGPSVASSIELEPSESAKRLACHVLSLQVSNSTPLRRWRRVPGAGEARRPHADAARGIRQLRREIVHLEQGVVLLPRAKGGARPVVLNEARKILQAQLELHNKAGVFPSPEGVPYSRIHMSRVFRKAARAAGLKDFHFDGLRHHGATTAPPWPSTAGSPRPS